MFHGLLTHSSNGLMLLALLLSGTPAIGEVRIVRKEVEVERRTFDPVHPPADFPPLKDGEAAATKADFGCAVQLDYRVADQKVQEGRCTTSLKVQKVVVTIQLKITLWLPIGASEKLTAHEEGHRQIDQRVYERAVTAARALAHSIDGTTLHGQDVTCPKAESGAIKAASDELLKKYLDQTAEAAIRLSEVYDDLTAHGTRAEPAEDEAIRQTFDLEKRHGG